MTGTKLKPNRLSDIFLAPGQKLRGRMLLFFISTLLAAGLSSCASGVKLESPPVSIRRLENIVEANLPGGVRKKSVNGREFYSQYFDPQTLGPAATSSSIYRALAIVTILGDRRPYTISIYVERQRLTSDGSYVDEGYDQATSRRIADSLRVGLDESRKERNLVDDFRPF